MGNSNDVYINVELTENDLALIKGALQYYIPVIKKQVEEIPADQALLDQLVELNEVLEEYL